MGKVSLSTSLSTKANTGIQGGHLYGEASRKSYFGFSEVWSLARPFRKMGVGDANRYAETSGQTQRGDSEGAVNSVGSRRIVGCGSLPAYRFTQSYNG